MARSFTQYDLSLWGSRYGRTTLMWQMMIQSALDKLDSGVEDEVVVLVVRPTERGNIRITFKKEPDLERRDQITQSIVDDPHVVDFPNG